MPKSVTLAFLLKKTAYLTLLGVGFWAVSFALPPLASFAPLAPLAKLSPLGQVAHAAPAGNSANSGNSGGQVYNDVPYPGDLSYVGSYAPTSGNANDASVLINSDFAGYVLGGYSKSGNASNNNVLVSGGSVANDVFGGYSESGNVINNSVLVSGGNINWRVIGGSSTSGTAINNSVFISGGNIKQDVYGGGSHSGNATHNSVFISGGNINQNVSGGSSNLGTASNNSVLVSGGSVKLDVSGGFSTFGTASNNSVLVSGGSVGRDVAGGFSTFGTASNNSVLVSGGSVGRDVAGGWNELGTATQNSVFISGGNIGGNVIGGYSDSGNAINNQVSLLGKPVFIKNGVNETILYGGYSYSPATTGDLRTGNTLNVFSSGIEAKNIANFQHYNFLLQASNNAGLNLLDVAGTDLGGTLTPTLAVPYAQSGSLLAVNRSITLLQSAGPLSNVPVLNNGQAVQGASLIYDYSLAQSGNSIVATVNSVQANPQAEALSQGRLAGLASLGMGADLVAGAGMNNALAAANAANSVASAANAANSNNLGAAPAAGSEPGYKQGSGQGYGLVPFMAVSTSFLRYNVGSNMDVDGAAVLLGLAKKWQGSSAEFLLGAFAEASLSNNKSHNSFNNQANVTGKSDNDSVGGGILARMELTGTALKGLYTEASLRVGQLNSHYKSNDLQDYSGNTVSYDTDSIYYGAHAGLGYILALSDKASLDLYAKYFWTHQEGENMTILGDEFKFDDANSQRTRLGGRFSYALCDELAPYAGAAWEYEFDGKAKATTYGFDVPAPSLKGSTGVGELGLSFTPNALSQNAFSVDLGLQGYTGMREGLGGSVQMKFEF